MKSNEIAFFDFDGTITEKDSFVDFMRYSKGDSKFFLGFTLLSPLALLYFLNFIPGWKMKEFALVYFFKGMNIDEFNKLGEDYALNGISRIVRKESLDRINWHKQRGDKLVVVSASLESWLLPWCKQNGLELISTKLEENDGKLTGKIFGKSCAGEEKARLIKNRYDLAEYDFIYAYGNSYEDDQMLALANERYYNWNKIS